MLRNAGKHMMSGIVKRRTVPTGVEQAVINVLFIWDVKASTAACSLSPNGNTRTGNLLRLSTPMFNIYIIADVKDVSILKNKNH